MKKIYALLLAFIAVAAQAQVKVTYLGTEVKDGDVLTLSMVEQDWGGGWIQVNPDEDTWHGYEPYVKNTGDSAIPAMVKVTATLQGEYKAWSICGLGLGTCVIMPESSYTCSFQLASGEDESFQMHCPDFKIGQYGTYDIVCDFQSGDNKMTFTLHYVYADASGIHNAVIDGTQVKFNAGALDFSFLTPATRILEVYSLSGKLLQKASVGQTGSMSVKGLQAGTYVYRVVENGHKLTAGKFLLK